MLTALSGGVLDHEYELWQFHAHWGSDDAQGSEHQVNGKMYAAELHLVHWNKKYESPNIAAGKPDGLAVLGFFMEIGKPHDEFEKIVKALAKIKNKNEKCDLELDLAIDCNKFFPTESLAFWHYEGSLTTPPLLESVMWHVFQKPIQVSEEQMKAMRSMNFATESSSCGKMVNNYRPPCPLNGRSVRRM